ncbi:MAG TPA: hypothetical protein VGI22_20465 [Xanthobacteraceae bacterium]|jgi:hypothetical protein
MPETSQITRSRRIIWQNVLTVVSAAILISAEVFGAAFAGGWAVANLFEFGIDGVRIFQAIFFVLGIAVMIAFVRHAQEVEPFWSRR